MLVAAIVLGGALVACSVLVDSDGLSGPRPVDASSQDVGLDSAGDDAADGSVDDAADAADAPARDRYFDEVMSDQPIAYFRLADSTASCKNEIDGSPITGVYPTAGVTRNVPGALSSSSDGALRFDDAAARLTVAGALDFPGDQPFTIEAWVRLDELPTTSSFDIACDSTFTPGARTGWLLFVDQSAKFRSELWNANVHLLYTFHDVPATQSSFHHVVLFHSDVDHLDHLMLDGRVSNDGKTANGPGARVVNDALQLWGGFRGALDELAIYDKAIGPDRIVAHYLAR